ncbi:hypothetical protein Hanom_Chr14g01325081 [Helianthus anomalus]
MVLNAKKDGASLCVTGVGGRRSTAPLCTTNDSRSCPCLRRMSLGQGLQNGEGEEKLGIYT